MRTTIFSFALFLAVGGTPAIAQKNISLSLKDSLSLRRDTQQQIGEKYVYKMRHALKGIMLYDPSVNVKPVDYYIEQGYQIVKIMPITKRKSGQFWKDCKEVLEIAGAAVALWLKLKQARGVNIKPKE